jgi:hypothetical protein
LDLGRGGTSSTLQKVDYVAFAVQPLSGDFSSRQTAGLALRADRASGDPLARAVEHSGDLFVGVERLDRRHAIAFAARTFIEASFIKGALIVLSGGSVPARTRNSLGDVVRALSGRATG